MKSRQSNGAESQPREGRQFDLSATTSKPKNESRKAQTFIPNHSEALDDVPEAITAGERLPHVSEYSGIGLEALPVKGLKSFFFGLGSLLLIVIGWEVFAVFESALEIHRAIAYGFLFLILLVGGLGLRLLWRYLRDQENLGALEDIQKQALRLSSGHDFGNAKLFVHDLKAFYSDKPQMVYLQRALEHLPDYSNDREVVVHVDNVFLRPLDKEALRRVSNYCLQTGVAVAASPWAALDMMLSLWRSVKMIDDVAQVYGMRPSSVNRYKLLKLVIHQLAFVGATEIVIDQATEELGSSTLAGIASARLGQGLGAGVYTARIGIAAMKASRPVAFSKENQPKTKSVILPVIEKIKAMISGTDA